VCNRQPLFSERRINGVIGHQVCAVGVRTGERGVGRPLSIRRIGECARHGGHPQLLGVRQALIVIVRLQQIRHIQPVSDQRAFVDWTSAEQRLVQVERRRKTKVRVQVICAAERYRHRRVAARHPAERAIRIVPFQHDEVVSIGQQGECIVAVGVGRRGGPQAIVGILHAVAVAIQIQRNADIRQTGLRPVLNAVADRTAPGAIVAKHRVADGQRAVDNDRMASAAVRSTAQQSRVQAVLDRWIRVAQRNGRLISNGGGLPALQLLGQQPTELVHRRGIGRLRLAPSQPAVCGVHDLHACPDGQCVVGRCRTGHVD